MMSLDIEQITELEYQNGKVNDKPAILTFTRFTKKAREDLLKAGVHKYDIRHSDYNMDPATIEPFVFVNYLGTILTKDELVFPNPIDEYLSITEGQVTIDFESTPNTLEVKSADDIAKII